MYSKIHKKNFLLIFILLFTAIFSFQRCETDSDIDLNPVENDQKDSLEDLTIPAGFDYKTTQSVKLDISIADNSNNPLQGVLVEVYDSDPFENAEALSSASLLYKGVTNSSGHFITRISIPAYLDKIFVCPRYIGVQQKAELTITSSEITYKFGGQTKKMQKTVANNTNTTNYLYLGEWDTQGVPLYLEDNEPVDASLLQVINSSLPERVPVPDFHPEYLDQNISTNIKLTNEAEVSITFVHEGAGWKNTLGYYTYPSDNPPATVDDIDNMTVIFPNTSYENSGGGLHTGNKVQLKYYDKDKQAFQDKFPANTSIGWFVIADAWENTSITEGLYTHYSDFKFNAEAEDDLKQHNVLLLDNEREILILGFEDIHRDRSNCDHDFNDAVIYTSVTPFTALDEQDYSAADKENDSDNDGVDDPFDEYPQDQLRAFNNYTSGALAFEDLWPGKGDYDFNDLVLEYNFNCVTNSQNKIVDIQSLFIFQAIGAGFHNGFAFEIPVPASQVASIQGNSLKAGYVSLNPNGTEVGQENAVVVVCEDAYDVLSNPNGGFVNVYNHQTFVPFDSIQVNLSFATAQDWENTGTPPFNPFLIKSGNREQEIHLPNYSPTDLANINMFGQSDDNSDPASQRFYLTKDNLPWAIHLPQSFDHPVEQKQIINAYLHFAEWAESNGSLYRDWFVDKDNYRNRELIFQVPQQ